MSDKLPITVIITTYDPGDNSRYPLLLKVCEALAKNLKYPNLRYLITDDTKSYDHHLQMVDATQLYLGEGVEIQYINTAGRGVGFAKNNALREAFKVSPIVLLMEDDWLLTEPLDLLPHVQLLLDHDDIGIIRMGFLGGDMTAKRMDYGSWDAAYWWLQAGSGFYVYSGQTSLRHARYYSAVGWHDENCTPGQEEESMCWRYGNLENSTWSSLPDGYNLKNISLVTNEVRILDTSLQVRPKGSGMPKILWPCAWGTTFNASPFKNIGVGVSVNNVTPTGV